MDIRLIPYVQVGEHKEWTVPEDTIRDVYRKMQADGTHDVVFYDGTVKDEEGFLREMQHKKNFLYLIYDGDLREEVAFIWLNDFQARFAQFHFCAFSAYWNRADYLVDVGKQAVNAVLNMKFEKGAYLLDMLLGLVPEWNLPAIKFVQKVGGVIMCVLPMGAFNAKTGQSEPAVLFCATREILGGKK